MSPTTFWGKWLGTVEPYQASLHVQEGAKQCFFKPRPVPFAIKDAVGKELDSLERRGILKKVNNSDWAAPIVAVPKKDGKFRICGDYKVRVNQVLAWISIPHQSQMNYLLHWAREKVL